MTMFRLRIALRALRRNFNLIMYGAYYVQYNDSTLRFIAEAMREMYGVDLTTANHGHNEVQLKRFFTNFLLEETGWSVSKLSRELMSSGIYAKGMSRRTLQYYEDTHDEELENENIGMALEYGQEYTQFTKNIKSIL